MKSEWRIQKIHFENPFRGVAVVAVAAEDICFDLRGVDLSTRVIFILIRLF